MFFVMVLFYKQFIMEEIDQLIILAYRRYYYEKAPPNIHCGRMPSIKIATTKLIRSLFNFVVRISFVTIVTCFVKMLGSDSIDEEIVVQSESIHQNYFLICRFIELYLS